MSERFETQALDVDRFVKVNDCKPITNPIAFIKGGKPTPDGLLSEQIFGITHAERYGIYGYIDLGGWFIQPLAYKRLCRLNAKIKAIIYGTQTFSIKSGELVEDPEGDTGIKWLKQNFDTIKWSISESDVAKSSLEYIKLLSKQGTLWIRKMPVIPPGYRDVSISEKGISIGELNQLYQSLLMSCNSLKQTQEYGLSMMTNVEGRIQDQIASIFNWFGNGTTIGRDTTSNNLPGKTGLIRRSILAKTTDYSCRSVISAPNNKAEDIEDLMADVDHAAIPLAIAITCFKPYIMFWLRRFFENQFAGKHYIDITVKDSSKGDVTSMMIPIKDYQTMFTDAEFEAQIDRFAKGRFNRLIPVPIPVDEVELKKMVKSKTSSLPKNFYLRFKGHVMSYDDFIKSSNSESPEEDITSMGKLIDRPLTWCDLLYMAAVEMTADKTVLITRFPMDSYFNQYPQKINIRTTTNTKAMVVNGIFYRWYPDFDESDIGKNTSAMFEDTISMSNPTVGAAGGDYDGDTVICKPIYSIEANAEMQAFLNSKGNFNQLDGVNTKTASKEGIVCLYTLTNCPDKSWDSKFNEMQF